MTAFEITLIIMIIYLFCGIGFTAIIYHIKRKEGSLVIACAYFWWVILFISIVESITEREVK